MYKIAVACEKRHVAKHYSKCLKYKIFTINDNKIIKIKTFKVKENEQDKIPKIFNENNINYIICDSIGDLARKLFCDHNIGVIMDATGKCRQAVLDFMNNKLEESVLCSDINDNESMFLR